MPEINDIGKYVQYAKCNREERLLCKALLMYDVFWFYVYSPLSGKQEDPQLS